LGNRGLLGGGLLGSGGSPSVAACSCSRQYTCSYGNSGWLFSRSVVGNLLEDVLNLVDNLLENVLGVNPHLEVLVGDILSFQITTTSSHPFNVWSSQGQIYSGWSHPQGYVSGSSPVLTIGQDCAGQTLYYGTPNQQGLFGLIRVGALGDGGVLGNILNGLLGNRGLLGGGLLGSTGGLLGSTGGLLPAVGLKRDLVGSLLNGGAHHTYILNAVFPHWNFIGSLVGDLLGSILGYNPVIFVRVGDIITFRVTTTPEYPFNVCVSLLGGVCTPCPGWSHPQGYVSGTYPTLTVRADLARQSLVYVAVGRPIMSGLITVIV